MLSDQMLAPLHLAAGFAKKIRVLTTGPPGDVVAPAPVPDRAKKPPKRERRRSVMAASELTAQLKSNMCDMRHKLADIEGIHNKLKLDEINLETAIEDAKESERAVRIFQEEIQGDWELMTHKAQWMETCDAFVDAALGRNADIVPSTQNLAPLLCDTLAKAEPDMKPNAAALVARHPLDPDVLRVYHCTKDGALRTGDTLRPKGPSPPELVVTAWEVMESGEAELHNPHGLERDYKHATSVVPLKAMSGDTFAAIVSGPPAMPDELLEYLGRVAGPLMERVWKVEQVEMAVFNVCQFIKSFSLSAQQLVHVNFTPREAFEFPTPVRGDDAHVWTWQALQFTDPKDAKCFLLPLRWRLGEPIGVVRVEYGTFTPMTEKVVLLLHTLAVVLHETVVAVEEITPGTPPPLKTEQEVMLAFEAKRADVVGVLTAELHAQLHLFDEFKVFGELGYLDPKVIDDEMLALVQGALCLLGYPRKAVQAWKQIKACMSKPAKLKERMLALQFGRRADEQPWADFRAVTQHTDYEELARRCSAAFKVLIRWMRVVEMIHNIALALDAEHELAARDPNADRLFDLIDHNGDGFVTSWELVNHMIREFPNPLVHRLLRSLDTDNDGQISREEWHKGWNAGMMMEILAKANEANHHEKSGKSRLTDRRGSAMALTAAAAAREFETKQILARGQSSSKHGKKEKPAGTKAKAASSSSVVERSTSKDRVGPTPRRDRVAVGS